MAANIGKQQKEGKGEQCIGIYTCGAQPEFLGGLRLLTWFHACIIAAANHFGSDISSAFETETFYSVLL